MSDLNEFKGRWFVVKIGGELSKDRPALAGSVGRAVKAFVEAGIKVAVIHGAGPQIDELSARLGLKPVKVAGRRVTDEATLEVLKMTLAGQVSTDVATAFRLAGVNALCTSGVSAGLVDAVKRPPKVFESAGPDPVDLGLVGDVTTVNVALLDKLAGIGVVPVVGCISGSTSGDVFNVNADTVATRVAAQLGAAKLFLVSNVVGVLKNRDDPSSRIPTLTPAEARAQIQSGVISGGMIPKVEESLEMLEQGIGAIHIVGIRPPEAILEEARRPGSHGTAFVR